ncbi:uncharacterized protein ACNLHF_004343 [Anomaloglossus baeobatrachus]|uniref:uncharacterized protein LOC142257599 n=1 Tax=Anomaloglossus baeobatrachus TaxID=238106 RepID=UPI003F4F9F59
MNLWIVLAFSTFIPEIITDENIPDFSHVLFVEKGKNTNLTCGISNKGNNIQWYKEKEDGGLEAVARSACYSRNEGRYFAHCEHRNVKSMEIMHVLTSDSGVYYCSSSGLDQTFNLANTLIVTEHNPEKPTLSILTSVQKHPKDSESTVLLCVAFNWTNEWDVIKWTLNDTEQKGWTTLIPDGSLRSLFVVSKPEHYPVITCYIKKSTSNEKISLNFTTVSKDGNDGSSSSSQCYIVLYVGIPIIIGIILMHQIILAIRRRTLYKGVPQQETHSERHVRFRPEDESVTYAAVKS